MRELGVYSDARICSSTPWTLHARDKNDVVGVYAAWIMENVNVPMVYRLLVGKVYALMGLLNRMESRTLCYVGVDLARDSFEFYVRLLIHFEYSSHGIVLSLSGVAPSVDAMDLLKQQAISFRSWLEERWVASDDSTCLTYALLQTPVDPRKLLGELTLQNTLFVAYSEHVELS
ncbi:hypothetical protein AAVH_27162 [Aphelenchoides avenae]|nr:hypothetical protein AAVH_27162 [Aphelenchus avenae]